MYRSNYFKIIVDIYNAIYYNIHVTGKGKEENPLSKKSKKKGKLTTSDKVALATAILNLIAALISWLKD